MKCWFCGEIIPDGTTVCRWCGRKQESNHDQSKQAKDKPTRRQANQIPVSTSSNYQDADQVQCPNCGGYMTVVQTSISIMLGNLFVWSAIGVGVIMVGLGLVPILLTSILGAGGSFVQDAQAMGFCACLVGVGLILLMIFIGRAFVPNPNFLECKLCGFRWDRRNYPPNYKAKVNPDLIQKGVKRMEEERRQSDY